MSVPIHNLYDYLYQCLEKRYITAHFYPFGHKEISDIMILQGDYFPNDKHFWDKSIGTLLDNLDPSTRLSNDATACKIFPPAARVIGILNDYNDWMLFHDQEPLNYDLYETISEDWKQKVSQNRTHAEIEKTKNLRWFHPSSTQKKWILVHSELNSSEVERYQKSGLFVCAYIWSHALLSLDWYRYAYYDQTLSPGKYTQKMFLIYALGQTGTRQYRKEFLQNLGPVAEHCQIGSFSSKVSSNSSAEYNAFDVNHTAINVVLETVVDSRIHLTEKTLRPIAVGQPFILGAGTGSLQYLQKYGFKTFSPWIDESYDAEYDTNKRLDKIQKEMHRLSSMPKNQFKQIYSECLKIAQYNQKIFFKNDFFTHIIDEFKTNVNQALLDPDYGIDVEFIWKSRQERRKIFQHTYRNSKSKWIAPYLRHVKKGGTLEDYVPPWEK
jgi:hypothetical protein